MTTPTGQISFSQIAAEFGYPSNNKLGGYRIKQFIGDREWPLDTGVPSDTNSPISFSQLRGKTLNVVVDFPPGASSDNIDVTAYYSGGVVVGGLKALPPRTGTTQGKKVYNLIRKTIFGNIVGAASLNTGTWDSSAASVNFIVTSTGLVVGRGGNGGYGASNDIVGGDGGTGGPGIEVNYASNITVEPGGFVAGGGGGGGGGGYRYNGGPDARGGGGGGGGGQGYNGGSGGPRGCGYNSSQGNNACGGDGGSGSIFGAGGGAGGGGITGGGAGGTGGNGGTFGNPGYAGQSQNTRGGYGGPAGAAIQQNVAANITATNITSGVVYSPGPVKNITAGSAYYTKARTTYTQQVWQNGGRNGGGYVTKTFCNAAAATTWTAATFNNISPITIAGTGSGLVVNVSRTVGGTTNIGASSSWGTVISCGTDYYYADYTLTVVNGGTGYIPFTSVIRINVDGYNVDMRVY
jgi:hypothetical protein